MAADLTFVTGATGFIGSHVVRHLLNRGDRVRIFARDSSSMANVDGLNCESVTGDLRDLASLVRCVQGCRRVYHVAADYRLFAANPQDIYDNNVGGTRNLLSACCEAGVERIVYTSTVGTIGTSPDGTPTDEDSPVKLDDMIGNYKRSKFMAEQVAMEFAGSGLPIVIVNPTAPIGPGDTKPTPTGKIILDFINGRVPAYVDTGLNLVAVEDIARGHLLAEEKGRIGERYILGGENWSFQQILDELSEVCGRHVPCFWIPWEMAMLLGYLDYFVEGVLMQREPSIPLEGVKMAHFKMYVRSDKAARELGYTSRPAKAALHEAVEYFRHQWKPVSTPGKVPSLNSKAL